MDLIPMFPILKHTQGNNYAQGAFNVTCYPQVKKVLEVHETLRSPAIIQVGNMAMGYMGNAIDMNKATIAEKRRGVKRVCAMVQSMNDAISIPVALNADHIKDFEMIKMLVEEGFTSVMIDGSNLSFDKNIELTREVVKYAHPYGVTVEAELGVLAGVEDDLFSENSTYTNPMKVVEFFKKTKVDCLALSYGTKHGVKKGTNVKLRKEIVIAAMENMRYERIRGVLVSHGSSTVPAYVVEDNNALGGKLNNAGGVPINELREVIKCGISKINIDTDLRLCITRNIREFLVNFPARSSEPVLSQIWEKMCANPAEIDFRKFLEPIRDILLDCSDRSESNIQKLVKCMENGIGEIVGSLVVQFGSVGNSNRVKRISLAEMANNYKVNGI
jgi:fructose-bisphosphate aldolase class II